MPIRCDVTDSASCQAAIAEAAERLGGINALVYSTGVGTLAKMTDLDADAWRKALDTNVVGAALITAAAIPFSRTAAAWGKTTPEQLVDQICNLAKKGATPSQIGVTLRDSHGIAQVKLVTGRSLDHWQHTWF